MTVSLGRSHGSALPSYLFSSDGFWFSRVAQQGAKIGIKSVKHFDGVAEFALREAANGRRKNRGGNLARRGEFLSPQRRQKYIGDAVVIAPGGAAHQMFACHALHNSGHGGKIDDGGVRNVSDPTRRLLAQNYQDAPKGDVQVDHAQLRLDDRIVAADQAIRQAERVFANLEIRRSRVA